MAKIIFQNDFFIIIDKPVGVLSVPSRLGEKDERPCAGLLLQSDLNKQIYPCHRLDFEVSGLLMFALEKDAHRVASRWFEQGEIQKKYEAWTTGFAPSFTSDIWNSKLLRGKKRAYEAPHGKESITNVKFLGTTEKGHLRFELEPVTGRSHQLRYELFKHEFPILGDTLYGSPYQVKEGIALRSFEIDFSKCPERELLKLPLKVSVEGITFFDEVLGGRTA